jgi:hypothetical protein
VSVIGNDLEALSESLSKWRQKRRQISGHQGRTFWPCWRSR